MAASVCSSFSESKEYFVNSGADGQLKLWETHTGTLKQQYTPTSHLSATCTCLSWCPTRLSDAPKKSKKKRKSSLTNGQNQDLIAMGTSSGSILVYNVAKADLETTMDDGHTGSVNDLCWDVDTDCIYSCSDDAQIIQWSLVSSGVKSKWKSDDAGSIYSVALVDTDNLLTGSRAILWWDLKTKQVIKKFTGHSTEVTRILSLKFSDESTVYGSYFLSSAADDRMISAWQLNKDDSRIAMGTFSVNEEIVNFGVSKPASRSQPIILAAVTKSGTLQIFEHLLNGKCKKPLRCKVKLQIASDSDNGVKSVPLYVLNVAVIDGRELLIAYGTLLKPTFEKILYDDCSKSMCLVRKHPVVSNTTVSTAVTKIQTPEVTRKGKVLVPGLMVPSEPSEHQSDKKRKRAPTTTSEMSMEQRLSDLKLKKNFNIEVSADKPPQPDNMVHLLTQGLQSNDRNILNTVLQKTNEMEIRNTIRRLPIHYVQPLLKELTNRMHNKGQSNNPEIKWIVSVLTNHTSYLMTRQNMDDLLRPLYQFISSRLDLFNRMSRLTGRLNLILSHVTSRNDQDNNADIPDEPLLVFQDDSPDELDDPMKAVHSESEDNWGDLSDLENLNNGVDDDEEMGSSFDGSEDTDSDADMT